MNRRDFAKSLAALGLAPALPPLTAAAASPGFTTYMYGLGAHLARSTGHCSPDMLMQHLRLAPEAARAMQAQLIRSGVISAPRATSVASAVQPYIRGVIARGASGSALAKTLETIADETLKPGPEAGCDSINPESASSEASSSSDDPHP